MSTYVVTNTGDNGGVNPTPGAGTGTLRQAIVDANYYNTGTATNSDQIQFNIPTSDSGYNSTTGKFTISLSGTLPTITDPVVINGFSQPGSSANTLPNQGDGAGDNAFQNIVLGGTQITGPYDLGPPFDTLGAAEEAVVDAGPHGLVLAAGNSTVTGLVIQNFSATVTFAFDSSGYVYDRTGTSGAGIELLSSGNTVAGNSITNSVTGVLVNNVPNNTIGGTTSGARNLIGSNGGYNPGNGGIYIQGSGATGNQVQGDYIGTDGSQLWSQCPNGILIDGSSNNVVGGTLAGAGNVIAASGFGVFISTFGVNQSPASGNIVEGNYIGLNASGTAIISGVQGVGVGLGNTNATVIGGTTTEARNVISGWPYAQVALNWNPMSNDDVVEGNYIGTNAAGTAGFVPDPASSSTNGIVSGNNTLISDNLISGVGTAIHTQGAGDKIQGNKIGTDATGSLSIPNGVGVIAASCLIGGTTPGTGNIIAFNDGPAVEVPFLWTGCAIEGNSIYGNGGPAIDNFGQFGDNLGPTLIDTN